MAATQPANPTVMSTRFGPSATPSACPTQRRPRRLELVPALCLGLIWWAVASWIAVAEHETYNSTSRDIGVYLQVLSNTASGRPYATTLLESNRIHLAEHVAPLLALLSPAYAVVPDPRWLFILQQAVLAASAIPVYVLARRLIGGAWLPTLVVAAFFAMPTLVEVALDAFYPITFAALPIGWSAYFLLTRRVRPGVACALVALLVEEEAALTVLGLGAFLLLRSPRRAGLALLATATVSLVTLSGVVMPRFHEPSTVPTAGNRTSGHFDDLRRDPGHALETLVGQRVPLAMRWLIAPTGGVPLLAPQVLAIDLPHAAVLLLADKEGRYRRHWAAPMLPVIWLATVVGLARLRRPALRLIGAALLVVGAGISYVADSSLPGGGDHEADDVVWTARAEQLDYLVRMVPPDASVAASRRVLAQLADRPEFYVYPPSYAGKLWPPERRVQAYVLDVTNDQTREALAGPESPLRASRPYAIHLAGQTALGLTERSDPPERPVGRDIGSVRLEGYDARPDDAGIDLTLHWRVIRRPSRVLTRFARVVDGSDAVSFEERGTALDTVFPSTVWSSGQVILDRVHVPPAHLRPVRVETGWIDEAGVSESAQFSLELDPAR